MNTTGRWSAGMCVERCHLSSSAEGIRSPRTPMSRSMAPVHPAPAKMTTESSSPWTDSWMTLRRPYGVSMTWSSPRTDSRMRWRSASSRDPDPLPAAMTHRVPQAAVPGSGFIQGYARTGILSPVQGRRTLARRGAPGMGPGVSDEVGEERYGTLGRRAGGAEVADQRGEVPHGHRRGEVQAHDTGGQAESRQPGQHGDPDSRTDEADGRVVVLGLDGEPGAEPRRVARRNHEPVPDAAGIVVAHPGLPPQLRQRDRGLVLKWVAAGHDGDELVLDEVDPPVAAGDRVVRRIDDEVDVRPRPAAVDLVENELEDEVRELLAQSLDERRHPGRAGGGEVPDGEPARTALPQVRHELVDPAPLAHELVAVPLEDVGRLGGHDATAHPMEEGEPGLPLECRQVLAHGRGRQPQVVGRSLDRPAGDDRAEDADTVHIEHGNIVQRDLTTP